MIASALQTFMGQCFAGPVVPATLLVLAVLAYAALTLVGVLDLDVLDFDLDAQGTGGVGSLGFLTLKFLNVGQAPVMVWLCVFAVCWWAASLALWIAWDARHAPISAGASIPLALRNLAIGLVAAKYATAPLGRFFVKSAQRTPRDLIGRICTITTITATADYGQASCPTEAAPLLMNVKTLGETLSKGDRALIVDYDAERRIYYVQGDQPPLPT